MRRKKRRSVPVFGPSGRIQIAFAPESYLKPFNVSSTLFLPLIRPKKKDLRSVLWCSFNRLPVVHVITP